MANYTADEVKDALAFQKLKNEIIGLAEKWDEYAKAQAIAKEKWFRHQGIDVYTVKVYPNGSHNLMGVPPDNPNEFVRLKRSHRVSSKRWSTGRTQLRRRASTALDH